MLTLNPISGAFDMVGLTQTSADARYVKKSGDVMTGLLQFSGTTHAGLQLNSLTTTQRDALTPANGMLLYNSTTSRLETYENGGWKQKVNVSGDTMTGSLLFNGSISNSLNLTSISTTTGRGVYLTNDPTGSTPYAVDVGLGQELDLIYLNLHQTHTTNEQGSYNGIRIIAKADAIDSSAGIEISNQGVADALHIGITGNQSLGSQNAPTGIGIDLNKGSGLVEGSNNNLGFGTQIWDWSQTDNNTDTPVSLYLNKRLNLNTHNVLFLTTANRNAIRMYVPEDTGYDGTAPIFDQWVGRVNNPVAQRMIINASGQIGVGPNAPLLDIESFNRIGARTPTGNNISIYFDMPFSGTGRIVAQDGALGGNGRSMIFSTITNLLETARFDTSGKMGIGTNNPGSKLEVQGTIAALGGLYVNVIQSPTQPVITPQGTAGSTTYGYKITFLTTTGETAGSTEGTTSTGNTTLSSSNYNKIAFSYPSGKVISKVNIYRTTSSGTPSGTGLIGTVTGGTLTFNDTGLTATTAVPTTDTSGNSGFGLSNPTALVHLKAGTASANTSPLKFTSGTNLTTPEDGAMEYDGSHLYYTIGATRYQIDQQSAAAGDIVGPASAANNNVVFFDGTTGKLVKDSGLTLSGSNTGDQTITLTGNVTGSGTGSFATTIAAGVVTNAMLAGSITAANLVGTDITTVGTIGTGTWQGTKVAEAYGGTNQSTYALGDILYSSASNTLSKLAGNTTSTKKFLRQTGNGSVSAAPAWDTLATGDIPDLSGTYQPLDSDLTTIAGLTATTDNFLVSVSSAWASRTPTQVKSTLSLNNVENTALSTWAGTSNITTLGTIGTGIWQGTAINRAYVTGLLQSDISGLTTASSPTFVALTLSGASVFTSASAANVIPLTINQNDTTNNPTALLIANTGTGVSLDITAPNIAAAGSTANLRIFTTNSEAADQGGGIIFGGYITGTSTSQAHGGISARKENATSANTRAYMRFDVVGAERMRIDSNGNLGFGGAPASNQYVYNLTFVTTAAKTIGMERMTTAATAGQSLTITSQGAKSGSTNKAGGNLVLGSGISTGSGTGNVQIQATGNTAGSTSDNSLSTIATFDITGAALTTKIITYNNISTVSNGIPSEVATIDSTGLTANVGATTLYATPATAGMYRVSAYVVETTAGSLSSTLPNVQIVYTDSDSNTSVTIDATPVLGVAGIGQTGALTANTVGTVSTGVIVLYVKASTTIQYQTVNYASNLSGMTYALRIKLEAL